MVVPIYQSGYKTLPAILNATTMKCLRACHVNLPITIMAIWRGKVAKHMMTMAVTTIKENESVNEHFTVRESNGLREIKWKKWETYVLKEKPSHVPLNLPCEYFASSVCYKRMFSCQPPANNNIL